MSSSGQYDPGKDWWKALLVAIVIGAGALTYFDRWDLVTDLLPDNVQLPAAAPGGAPPGNLIVRETPPDQKIAVSQAMLNSGQVLATGPEHVGCDALGDLRDRAASVDWRVLQFLQVIVAAGFKPRVSCVNTGHERDKGYHPRWQAMDIDAIDGQTVRSLGGRVVAFGDWMKSRPNEQLPTEVGGPPSQIDESRRKRNRTGPYFTDGDHLGHFHLGWANE